MRISAAGAVLLMLAGCGGAASNDVVGAPPANAVPAAPEADVSPPATNEANAAAPAADIGGARALIDRLYGSYARGEAPAMEDVLTYDLERALARTANPATGTVQDPLCQCDGPQNFRYTIQALEPTPGGATARLDIQNGGARFMLTLKLRPDGNRWQIEDIVSRNGSLLTGRR